MSDMISRKISINPEGNLYIEAMIMFDRRDFDDIDDVIELHQNPDIHIEVKDSDEHCLYLNVGQLLQDLIQ